jgi:hypothetical protein
MEEDLRRAKAELEKKLNGIQAKDDDSPGVNR